MCRPSTIVYRALTPYHQSTNHQLLAQRGSAIISVAGSLTEAQLDAVADDMAAGAPHPALDAFWPQGPFVDARNEQDQMFHQKNLLFVNSLSNAHSQVTTLLCVHRQKQPTFETSNPRARQDLGHEFYQWIYQFLPLDHIQSHRQIE